MNLDWLLNPVTHYALIGSGLLCTLVLWICNSREMRAVRSDALNSRESVDATVKELTENVEQMREALKKKESKAPEILPASRLNPPARTQALLLQRRGEPIERIASMMGIPKNEIEFLFKLNRLLHPDSV